MGSFLARLLEPGSLSPHGFCLAFEPELLWLHAGADLAVALAYFTIPAALMLFVRQRRDLAFPWVFWLFAAFILACGATHLLGVVSLWVPLYRLEAAVMVVTAIASLATAAALWWLLPRALALPSPAALRAANAALRHEITERDRVTTLLRDSEARFRAFFEQASDLVGLLRQDVSRGFVFSAANPALCRLLGVPEAALTNSALVDVLAPLGGAAFEETCRRCTETGTQQRYESHYHRPSRPDGTVEGVLVPLVDPVTGDARVLASLRDITERRELERQLAQAQKMEAIGQITGGVAHDFNNILMGVSGTLQLLQREAVAPLQNRLISSALQATDRGSRLIRHLLAFARRQPLQPEPCDVNLLVAAWTNEVMRHTIGGNFTLVTDLAPGLWAAQADPAQLEATLLNLVLNARDALPDGGTIHIATSHRHIGNDAPRQAALALAAGDYICIEVADNGVGMTEAVAARVFDPFFTTKAHGIGAGLGLSQVYGFARQSGGTVDLSTSQPGGTRVTLYLPRAVQDPVASLSS